MSTNNILYIRGQKELDWQCKDIGTYKLNKITIILVTTLFVTKLYIQYHLLGDHTIPTVKGINMVVFAYISYRYIQN